MDILSRIIRSVVTNLKQKTNQYKLTRPFVPLVEELEMFFFSTNEKSHGRCQVRDVTDYKRMMIMVVFALLPTLIYGIYNCGHQIARIYQGRIYPDSIRTELLSYLNLSLDPSSFISSFVLGCMYFVPIYVVTLVVGGVIEVTFSLIRKKSINEGFLVTSLIFPMILPVGIELWKVALGISFGIIFGKEVFGGTGKNIFNPALVGRIFLFFSYPGSMSGSVWLDGVSGATMLSFGPSWLDGISGATLLNLGQNFLDEISFLSMFVGNKLGCIGEVSPLMCIIGGSFLLFTKIASLRIVLSSLLSLGIFAYLFELLSLTQIPFYYQYVLGGACFGIFFMATDPVSASYTKIGKYIYGGLIGFLIIVIRTLNHGFAEGVMFAILIANALAPIIDHCVLGFMISSRDKKIRLKEKIQ